jgi:hypothetical protein
MSDSPPTKMDGAAGDSEGLALRARYRELVNQKYLQGLTAAEEAEFEDLGQQIDQLEASFYQPAIEYLQQRVAQKRQTGD